MKILKLIISTYNIENKSLTEKSVGLFCILSFHKNLEVQIAFGLRKVKMSKPSPHGGYFCVLVYPCPVCFLN